MTKTTEQEVTIESLQADLQAAAAQQEESGKVVAALEAKLAEATAANDALEKKLSASGKAQPKTGVPAYYSGKVAGSFVAVERRQTHPFTNIVFDTSGGVSNKNVGKIDEHSWMDLQIQGGTIRFVPEA